MRRQHRRHRFTKKQYVIRCSILGGLILCHFLPLPLAIAISAGANALWMFKT